MRLSLITLLALAAPSTALACGATCPTGGAGTAAAAGVAVGLVWLVTKLF